MSMPSPREAILKMAITIRALHEKRGITAIELGSFFGYDYKRKSYAFKTAQRYIDAASLVYPVIEDGFRQSDDAGGRGAIVYKILEERN